jgi:hypothetical protein
MYLHVERNENQMQNIETTSDILPSFLLNSIPKSGTHLILQIIKGIPHVTHDPEKHLYEGMNEQIGSHYRILKDAASNECVSAHVYCLSEWALMFKQLNMKMLFLSRDLRDILVSFVYFVRTIPNQIQAFASPKISLKQSMLVLINGIPEIGYPNLADYYRYFLAWMQQSNVLTVTFEDLILSEQSRINTIQRIIDFLWEGLTPPVSLDQMLITMKENINSDESPTFRKGKIGGWRDEFDEEIKTAFKAVAGDLLIELGYEKDYNW